MHRVVRPLRKPGPRSAAAPRVPVGREAPEDLPCSRAVLRAHPRHGSRPRPDRLRPVSSPIRCSGASPSAASLRAASTPGKHDGYRPDTSPFQGYDRDSWNRPPGTPRQFVGHAVVRRVGNVLSPNLAARHADVRHRREDRLPALHHLAEARGNEGQRRRRNHRRVNAEPDGAGTKPAPTARASGFHGVADGPPRPRGGVLRMARCQVRDWTIARGTVPDGDVKYRCQLVFRQRR